MKRITTLAFAVLSLGLTMTSCASVTPTPTVEAPQDSPVEVRDLGPVIAHIYPEKTTLTLKKGYAHAKVLWSGELDSGIVRGSDNVYPSNSPDVVALGSKHKIKLEVAE